LLNSDGVKLGIRLEWFKYYGIGISREVIGFNIGNSNTVSNPKLMGIVW